MKKRYYLGVGLAVYAISVLVNAPATLVRHLIPENNSAHLQIDGLNGTLWNGAFSSLSSGQHRFGETRWKYLPSRMLMGQISLEIETRYLDQPISGTVGTSLLGTIRAYDLRAQLGTDTITRFVTLPMGKIDGTINIDLSELSYSHGAVPEMTGSLEWQDASVTVAQTARLGDIRIELQADAIQKADISNEGGDITILGTGSLDQDKRYEIDLRLTPANNAGRQIAGSLALFAQKQPDGSYVLKNQGNLAELGLL